MSSENGKLESSFVQSRFLMHVLAKQSELYLARVEKALQNLIEEDRHTPEESIIEILELADQSLENEALEFLGTLDQPFAQCVRQRMFSFEHMEYLDDRAVQKVLREIEMHPLALALKGAAPGLQNKILRNMSQRAAEILKEEMTHMGPARLNDVEDAQRQIASIMRMLRDKGEIKIARSSDELIG